MGIPGLYLIRMKSHFITKMDYDIISNKVTMEENHREGWIMGHKESVSFEADRDRGNNDG